MELILPSSASLGKTYKCEICGTRFPERQREDWARHVRRCDRQKGEIVDELYAMKQANFFTSVADREQFLYRRRKAGIPTTATDI